MLSIYWEGYIPPSPSGFGTPDYTAVCDQSRCNNDPLDVSHRLLSTFGSENRFIGPPFLLNGNPHYYVQFVNSNLALGTYYSTADLAVLQALSVVQTAASTKIVDLVGGKLSATSCGTPPYNKMVPVLTPQSIRLSFGPSTAKKFTNFWQ